MTEAAGNISTIPVNTNLTRQAALAGLAALLPRLRRRLLPWLIPMAERIDIRPAHDAASLRRERFGMIGKPPKHRS